LGYAIVAYSSKDDADAAIRHMNNGNIDGNSIVVAVKTNKPVPVTTAQSSPAVKPARAPSRSPRRSKSPRRMYITN
jgi:RNA recognition motif-containing protein